MTTTAAQAELCQNVIHLDVIADIAWLVENEAAVTWFSGMGSKSVHIALPNGRTVTAWSWRAAVSALRG